MASRTATTRRPRRDSQAPKAAHRREETARQLGGHAGDAIAVGLLVLGALTGLGLASDLAGAVGRGLDTAVGALFGLARFAVPGVCLALAVLCFRVRPSRSLDEDDGDVAGAEGTSVRTEPAPIRVGVGVALLGIAAVGALHLASGTPPIDGPLDGLREAGGFLGAAVGEPLDAIAGTVGASVVLAGFAVLGALLAPGVPMRRVAAAFSRTTRVVVGGLRSGARRLTDLGDGVPVDGHELHEVDHDAATDPVGSSAVAVDDELPVVDETGPVEVRLYDVESDLVPDVGRPAVSGQQLAIDLGPSQGPGVWRVPTPDLLARGNAKHVERRLIEEGGRVLEATLHQHGVDARVIGMTVGPTVTRYEVQLAAGVKVSRVTSLGHDLAYALASSDVRILAPIPGRSAIGVEVPNKQRQLVTLGDILASPEAARATHPLEVGLGRDIAGRPVMLNLAALPHVLIAGATGAGKSSSINAIVTSLLMRNTPDVLRLILVDPKRVELGAYNDVPHLLTPVVTNPKKAANALAWAVREMDLRYELLAEVGVRDITGYNAAHERGELPTRDEPDPVTGKGYERLPYIVVVVDELNDLMMVAPRDVEASICRIAQMARAVGIHLVIATQRPSVDVITGVIKANVPSRLAFSVSSIADSRVVLDQAGAEKLVGQGDLLALTPDSNKAQRIQGAWVDEACVRKVAAHWKRQVSAPSYVEGVASEPLTTSSPRAGAADDDDELLGEAMELVVRSGLGSTSMLQRKLRVGFARAGRLMDLLERRGIVGPSEGSKARSVLMTVEELEGLHQRA